jgi:hypothetical protein
MYVNFSIRNFFNTKKDFKSYFFWHKKISKNKHFEMECITDSWHMFSVEFKIGFREDHAGVRIALGVLGFETYLQIYDIRHWDYERNCWDS